MNNIRIINWNREALDKELNDFEDKLEKSKIENINTTSEDQKFFWLTVFLPSIIAIICTIAIWILAGKFIDIKGLKMLIRIVVLCIAGFFVATRTFKIFQMPVFAAFLNPPECSQLLKFHKAFRNTDVIDIEFYDTLATNNNKIVRFPDTVKFSDGSSFSFSKDYWQIMPTNKNETVIDVAEMMIFCTDVDYLNEE